MANGLDSNEESVNPEPIDEAALNEEASRELAAMVAEAEQTSGAVEEQGADDGPLSSPQSQAERAAVVEALIFVSDEPLTVKSIADVLKEEKSVNLSGGLVVRPLCRWPKSLMREMAGCSCVKLPAAGSLRHGLNITSMCERF